MRQEFWWMNWDISLIILHDTLPQCLWQWTTTLSASMEISFVSFKIDFLHRTTGYEVTERGTEWDINGRGYLIGLHVTMYSIGRLLVLIVLYRSSIILSQQFGLLSLIILSKNTRQFHLTAFNVHHFHHKIPSNCIQWNSFILNATPIALMFIHH